MTEDRKEYRGTYHRYILTGEVYTLGEFTNKSKKLIKFQEELPEVVNYKLSKPDIRTKYITPKSYSLNITPDNIKAGFVTRYFIKKINSLNIMEINEAQFKAFNSNKIDPNLYQAISIDWIITGHLNDKVENGVLLRGVNEQNKNTIKLASKKFTGLNKKIFSTLSFK